MTYLNMEVKQGQKHVTLQCSHKLCVRGSRRYLRSRITRNQDVLMCIRHCQQKLRYQRLKAKTDSLSCKRSVTIRSEIGGNGFPNDRKEVNETGREGNPEIIGRAEELGVVSPSGRGLIKFIGAW